LTGQAARKDDQGVDDVGTSMRDPWAADADEVLAAFRTRVRSFLAANLPTGWQGVGQLDRSQAVAFVAEWRRLLHEHRLLAVDWPAEYGGGGLSKLEHVVLAEEFAAAGVPTGSTEDAFSIEMIGNTLLHWGSEAQKQYFLPRILSGEHVWCQGFSEPDAGSDLGSVKTQAKLDGDRWIIDGQKIWTSSAHAADWIFLLVRTDAAALKHHGITFLLCPMHQPGIEVRPIAMMSGESEFNEVFFTEAETPVENVVGAVNEGWRVAMTLLGHERGEEAAVLPIQFRQEFDRLLLLVREYGRQSDPLLRDRLAACYVEVETMRFLGQRVLSRYLQNGTLGPEASVIKLYWSEYHRRVTDLAMDVMGLHGLVDNGRRPARMFRADDPGAPNSTASWAGVFMNARAGTIYAGSSEIQRNILGELVLGLPKEPRPVTKEGRPR